MQKEIDMDLRVRITESQYEVLRTVAKASGDTLDEWLHTTVIQGIQSDIDLYFRSKTIQEKLYKKVGGKYGLTTQELMDLRVILISFMADKEAHKKIPRLESRAPSINRKGTRIGAKHIYLKMNTTIDTTTCQLSLAQ